MGTALRAELAHFGVDVCLINPGPYATGFNDRMAKNPGEWFDRKTAAPEDVAVMDALVQRITVGQLDPVDVAKRYVELGGGGEDRARELRAARYRRAHEGDHGGGTVEVRLNSC
jgi:hypothetical protein